MRASDENRRGDFMEEVASAYGPSMGFLNDQLVTSYARRFAFGICVDGGPTYVGA